MSNLTQGPLDRLIIAGLFVPPGTEIPAWVKPVLKVRESPLHRELRLPSDVRDHLEARMQKNECGQWYVNDVPCGPKKPTVRRAKKLQRPRGKQKHIEREMISREDWEPTSRFDDIEHHFDTWWRQREPKDDSGTLDCDGTQQLFVKKRDRGRRAGHKLREQRQAQF